MISWEWKSFLKCSVSYFLQSVSNASSFYYMIDLTKRQTENNENGFSSNSYWYIFDYHFFPLMTFSFLSQSLFSKVENFPFHILMNVSFFMLVPNFYFINSNFFFSSIGSLINWSWFQNEYDYMYYVFYNICLELNDWSFYINCVVLWPYLVYWTIYFDCLLFNLDKVTSGLIKKWYEAYIFNNLNTFTFSVASAFIQKGSIFCYEHIYTFDINIVYYNHNVFSLKSDNFVYLPVFYLQDYLCLCYTNISTFLKLKGFYTNEILGLCYNSEYVVSSFFSCFKDWQISRLSNYILLAGSNWAEIVNSSFFSYSSVLFFDSQLFDLCRIYFSLGLLFFSETFIYDWSIQFGLSLWVSPGVSIFFWCIYLFMKSVFSLFILTFLKLVLYSNIILTIFWESSYYSFVLNDYLYILSNFYVGVIRLSNLNFDLFSNGSNPFIYNNFYKIDISSNETLCSEYGSSLNLFKSIL